MDALHKHYNGIVKFHSGTELATLIQPLCVVSGQILRAQFPYFWAAEMDPTRGMLNIWY